VSVTISVNTTHRIGWSEHVLNELEYVGDPDKRLLDPACGSGTFLVMAINRIRKWYDENREQARFDEGDLCRKILSNVIGFDLNPLAVMAARTNYLIAIRDLVGHVDKVEIPIYLCDSIMTPSEYGDLFSGGVLGKAKALETAAAKFIIPTEIATNPDDVAKYAEQLEFCVRNAYSAGEFFERCRDLGLSISEEGLHTDLYQELVKLDKANKNGVWARIIKNAFAPLFVGHVDYVAGNPPWINWESLPNDYRQATAPLWQKYDLFRHKGYKAKLGGGKDDISILFAYVVHDCYLIPNGRLGFVITQSVFKTKGGGEGFRTFQYQVNGRKYFVPPTSVHDMSDFQPFEGATNRTAVFVAEKSEKPFEYPVPYVIWRKETRGAILQDFTLEEVIANTSRETFAAEPVDSANPTSPWLTARKDALPGLKKVIGASDYTAYEGVNTGGLSGCFWVRILEVLRSGELLIENLYDAGKIKVERVQAVIEADLAYPILRGREVSRWVGRPTAQIILANRTDKLAGIPEGELKRKYPKTFEYLKRFEGDKQKPARGTLRGRALYKQYFSPADPFYSLYNVGPYTIRPWKVVWNRIDTKLQGVVVGKLDDKIVLCQETHSFATFDNSTEAHYFAALLNSSPSDLLVRSYSISKGFASPHILEQVLIPKFNATNEVHQQLAKLSTRCHVAADADDWNSVADLESKIDQEAANLWHISHSELDGIQVALADLK
jgi:hypothetical protein